VVATASVSHSRRDRIAIPRYILGNGVDVRDGQETL
jgi:hypothetical protein